MQDQKKTKTLIDELEDDIQDALETVKLLRKTKRALEMREFMVKYEPPNNAIEKALKRLKVYPKFQKNKELQDNGIKKSTKQDQEIDNIYQACSASSVDNGT